MDLPVKQAKLVAIGALLLAACGDRDIDRAQQLAADMTRDPASVQFRNVERCPNNDDVITGQMNAKNAFGAYVGFKPFFVDRGVVTIADEEQLGNSEGRNFVAWLVERCGRAER